MTLYFSVIVPPVVLSGTAFWLLLRRTSAVAVSDNFNEAPSLVSPKTADNKAMHGSRVARGFKWSINNATP